MPSDLSREQQKLLGHALRAAMVELVQNKPLTAKQVATELDSSVGNVHYHLQRLVAADLIDVFEQISPDGVTEKRYRRREASLGNDCRNPNGQFLVDIEETWWLNVAQTGQLINEIQALCYRWRDSHSQPHGRTKPLRLSIRCQTPDDS